MAARTAQLALLIVQFMAAARTPAPVLTGRFAGRPGFRERAGIGIIAGHVRHLAPVQLKMQN